MGEYWTSSGITVYDFDKCILALKKRHEDQLDRIKYLEEENRKLKDDAYKDAEMARMKSQFDEMKADYYRGFPITESEEKKVKEWMKKHDAEAHGAVTSSQRLKRGGVCGGNYSYEFIPTSIGTIGYVKCGCGARFEFQEIL